MPRQHTYGKRSRLIFDPLAAPATSSSPEQTSTKSGKPTTQKSKAVSQSIGGESKPKRFEQRPRNALGERSANEGAIPTEDSNEKGRATRRQRLRKIVQDEEDNSSNSDLHTLPLSNQENDVRPIADEQDTHLARPEDPTELPEHRTRPVRQTARRKPRKETSRSEATMQNSKPIESQTPPEPVQEAKKLTRASRTANMETPAADPQTQTLTPQETSPTSPINPSDPYEAHCTSLLTQSQHPLTSFDAWTTQLSEHFAVSKIAEASFGEVYRLSLHAADATLCARADESVIKVIALTPPAATLAALEPRRRAAARRRAEAMSAPADVANEVRLLSRMSDIPGFTNFRDVRVLRGRPGEAFVRAFRAFDRAQRQRGKPGSCFPDPGKRVGSGGYADTQLWAVVEMQDAGNDLERMVEEGACAEIGTAWDVFWQVVLSLAKGEEEAEFEHRDLHLGNICVRPRGGEVGVGEGGVATAEGRKLHFTGLETTIIDYTLSRARMSPAGGGNVSAGDASADGADNNDVAFHDLAKDPAVFEGDATDEYQYEIYRYMRSALFLDKPLASYLDTTPKKSGRSWQQYHPQTNLVWLHLVLTKLVEQINWPSTMKKRSATKKRTGGGTTDSLNHPRDIGFEEALRQVATHLDPENLGNQNSIASAGDLIHLAVAESWIDLEDVVGEDLCDDKDLVERLHELALDS